MVRLAARVEECREFQCPRTGARVAGRAHRDRSLSFDLGCDTDRVLEAEGLFDPGLRDRLPRGARALWEVRRGSLLPGRASLVIYGCVIHPVRELARGLSGAAADAACALDLLPQTGEGVPAVLAALSTSGWRGMASDDAGLFLFEPAPGGGYRRYGLGAGAVPAYLALESEAELKARVVTYADGSRAELVLRGLSARAASLVLGVPVRIVSEVFTSMAVEGEFLRISREEDDIVLRRA